MYNRYIPNGTAYTRVPEEDAPPFHQPGPSQRGGGSPGGGHRWSPGGPPPPGEGGHRPSWEPAAGEKKSSWLSGLLKNFKLDELDTGDILLLLIILFLFIDGDDLELIITLGLLLLFGLGGKEKEEHGAS